MVIDIEAATIVVFRRTGWICVDAAGVRRLVIGRELRAREDRDRPGQDLLSGEVISSGASTRPCGQTGPGTRRSERLGRRDTHVATVVTS